MGYFRGVVHGTAAGIAIGLLVAPQQGSRSRQQLRQAMDAMSKGIEGVQETARRVAPQIIEAADGAGEILTGLRSRLRGEEEAANHVDLGGSPIPPTPAIPVG